MPENGKFVPADENMHRPTEHPQFNESMYFNMVDGVHGFATLIRMGNRVNEGYAEVTVLVYLPDGAAAIRFARPGITGNDAFDAAGLRFEVVEPLRRMRVTFDGTAYRLARGTDLADPKKAFTESPEVPLRLALDYENLVDVHGLGDEDDAVGGIAGAADTIATGHYQAPCRVAGWVELDGERREISGLGFRDHSWGPRVWQGPKWWRWVSCQVDDRSGFVGWITRIGDTRPPAKGMVLRDGKLSLVRAVELESAYGPDPHYPESMRIALTTADGDTVKASGTVTAVVPLRHRRDGTTARLAEVICRYDVDGREGWGISEYHDLMLDGVPAGLGEA